MSDAPPTDWNADFESLEPFIWQNQAFVNMFVQAFEEKDWIVSPGANSGFSTDIGIFGENWTLVLQASKSITRSTLPQSKNQLQGIWQVFQWLLDNGADDGGGSNGQANGPVFNPNPNTGIYQYFGPPNASVCLYGVRTFNQSALRVWTVQDWRTASGIDPVQGWRRKRAREILTVSDTEDVAGNAAADGQVARLIGPGSGYAVQPYQIELQQVTTGVSGDPTQPATYWPYMANNANPGWSGSWEDAANANSGTNLYSYTYSAAQSKWLYTPGAQPDVLDSSNGEISGGVARSGDYIGPWMFKQIRDGLNQLQLLILAVTAQAAIGEADLNNNNDFTPYTNNQGQTTFQQYTNSDGATGPSMSGQVPGLGGWGAQEGYTANGNEYWFASGFLQYPFVWPMQAVGQFYITADRPVDYTSGNGVYDPPSEGPSTEHGLISLGTVTGTPATGDAAYPTLTSEIWPASFYQPSGASASTPAGATVGAVGTNVGSGVLVLDFWGSLKYRSASDPGTTITVNSSCNGSGGSGTNPAPPTCTTPVDTGATCTTHCFQLGACGTWTAPCNGTLSVYFNDAILPTSRYADNTGSYIVTGFPTTPLTVPANAPPGTVTVNVASGTTYTYSVGGTSDSGGTGSSNYTGGPDGETTNQGAQNLACPSGNFGALCGTFTPTPTTACPGTLPSSCCQTITASIDGDGGPWAMQAIPPATQSGENGFTGTLYYQDTDDLGEHNCYVGCATSYVNGDADTITLNPPQWILIDNSGTVYVAPLNGSCPPTTASGWTLASDSGGSAGALTIACGDGSGSSGSGIGLGNT